MGMAAGQARFLGLTARKTNVEFEGQQINQQRTSLSNQSANYNNQLLSLDVPTAPAVDSFTKTSYAWTAAGGTQTNTITSIVPNNINNVPNQYDVTYLQSYTATEAYKSSEVDAIARTLVPANGGTPAHYTYAIGSTNLTTVTNGTSEYTALQQAYQTANPSKPVPNFFKYTDPSSQAVSYFAEDQLTAGVPATDPAAASGSVNSDAYKIGPHQAVKTLTDSAILNIDASGRMTSITMNGISYPLNAQTSTDEAAYNDAMNKYEYQKDVYNKSMNDINAKISIIQQQDKSLELKLKQCDTEQQAISTELDAVKKVIDKNVESTFKTFG